MEGRRLRAYPFSAETLVLLLLCGVTAFFTSWTGCVLLRTFGLLGIRGVNLDPGSTALSVVLVFSWSSRDRMCVEVLCCAAVSSTLDLAPLARHVRFLLSSDLADLADLAHRHLFACICDITSRYVVIAKLSALTHQLLGQAKTCLILLAGALVFGSPLTATQVIFVLFPGAM